MNRHFIFSSIAISLLFNVSMILRIEQYISFPLALQNPPAIFWRFFALRRSRSLILLSNGTPKSFRNSRWFLLLPMIHSITKTREKANSGMTAVRQNDGE